MNAKKESGRGGGVPGFSPDTHCTLQADKSFKPLPIILSEILHLQNCRVQN